MKLRQLTVTVGISAHNEAGSIKNILEALRGQIEKGYNLKKIIVISDGSTDETVSMISSVKDPRIQTLNYTKRQGKVYRINQLFSLAHTDVLIILDADIALSDPLLVSKLTKPFLMDYGVQLTFGRLEPITPQNFIQRIVYQGVRLWDATRRSVAESDMYYCPGAIRAFSKQLYTHLKFPAIMAEDIYPFLYCVNKKYRYSYVKNAVVYYGLPATYLDYKAQMRRYLQSDDEHAKLFSSQLLRQYRVINHWHKLRVFAWYMLRDPIWTLLYGSLLLRPKIEKLLGWQVGSWQPIKSSKLTN